MDGFDNTVKIYTTWLDNPYVSSALTMFLIVYASMAAPKLPSYIANLFDYTLFKLLIFFLIVYVNNKNATVALVAAVALMVVIMILNRLKLGQETMEVVGGEEQKKLKLGNCTCQCSSFQEILPVVKTVEGKAVVDEIKKAAEVGVITPKQVVIIADKIAKTEKVAPVLVAKTEQGAIEMGKIVTAEKNGTISPEQAQNLAAKIVAIEEIAKCKQDDVKLGVSKVASPKQLIQLAEASATASTSSEHAAVAEAHAALAETHSNLAQQTVSESKPSMTQMAEEVMRRKQEETAKNGVEPSPEELRRICSGVLNEFRKSCSSCGTSSGSSSGSGSEITGHDSNNSCHAPAHQ